MANSKHGSWQCPYCQSFATIGEHDLFEVKGNISNYDNGRVTYVFQAIECPNSSCGQLTAHIKLTDTTPNPAPAVLSSSRTRLYIPDKNKKQKIDLGVRLLPPSKAKIFPEYVPLAIRDDYQEACLITNLSPKASATLSRRCLQTIIRDFWNIKNKKNLNEEIDALSKLPDVNADLISAFHDLRSIGNIGAHMEKDTNLIIDVESEEAEELIRFIESLIGLTYIEKHNRDQLFKKIKTISADKKAKKKDK
jgi:hypothetical protein